MHSNAVTLDLSILDENIHTLQEALSSSTRLMFVVKSDAYGHGSATVAARAAAQGVDFFAVAYYEEALEVRVAAPDADILVLGPIAPHEVAGCLEHRIIPVAVDLENARMMAEEARRAAGELEVHLKVDTGMGRLGFLEDEKRNAAELEEMFKLPGIHISGIMSHLATVDIRRPWLQEKQHERFVQAVAMAERICGRRLFRHFCSSRGIQFYPEWDFDAVRPGILLYGYGSSEPGMRLRTKPFLQLHSRVMQVKSVPEGYPIGYYSAYRCSRDTQIAVVGMGYADGYLRSLSNRGEALVNGHLVPVVGRISMNWITLDLGPDLKCKPGDEVVLMGAQGNREVWADRLGRRAGTIAYEILTAIHPRIKRCVV